MLTDSSDPCAECGSPATVYQRGVATRGTAAAGDDHDVEWVDEHRACSHGCDELVAAIPVSMPRQRRARRRVA